MDFLPPTDPIHLLWYVGRCPTVLEDNNFVLYGVGSINA